jgi:hypothetical protein
MYIHKSITITPSIKNFTKLNSGGGTFLKVVLDTSRGGRYFHLSLNTVVLHYKDSLVPNPFLIGNLRQGQSNSAAVKP